MLGNRIPLDFDSPFYRFGNVNEMIFNHDQTRRSSIYLRIIDGGRPLEVALNFGVRLDYQWSYGLRPNLKQTSALLSANTVSNTLPTILQNTWFVTAVRPQVPLRRNVGFGPETNQPIDPDGTNIINFLVNRWSDQDPKWRVAEDWLRKIDPQLTILKAPVDLNFASVRTVRETGKLSIDVNVSNQGAGMQNLLTVMSALIFSPEGATVIIEEPESHVHPRAQEVLVDLMNMAVKDWKKQVIVITHSWDMILPFASDIGGWGTRGKEHVVADSDTFSLRAFYRKDGIKVDNVDLKKIGKFSDLRDYMKNLWG